jgi:hypothetical protein
VSEVLATHVCVAGHVDADAPASHVCEHQTGNGSGASYLPLPSVSRKIAFVTA